MNAKEKKAALQDAAENVLASVFASKSQSGEIRESGEQDSQETASAH